MHRAEQHASLLLHQSRLLRFCSALYTSLRTVSATTRATRGAGAQGARAERRDAGAGSRGRAAPTWRERRSRRLTPPPAEPMKARGSCERSYSACPGSAAQPCARAGRGTARGGGDLDELEAGLADDRLGVGEAVDEVLD